MFRTYQIFWNRLYQVLDATIVVVSFLLAWYIKFHSGWLSYGGHHHLHYYIPVMLAAIPIFLAANWMAGLYKPMRSRSFWRETSAIIRGVVFGMLLFMSFLFVLHISDFSRSVLVIFGVSFAILTYVKHVGIQASLRALRARGRNKKFVVMVGYTSAVAGQILTNLRIHQNAPSSMSQEDAFLISDLIPFGYAKLLLLTFEQRI